MAHMKLLYQTHSPYARKALVFAHEVQLFVHDSAKIGKVSGATAQKFSGATP